MRRIPAGEWRAEVDALEAEGYAYLDFLTAIDRGAEIEVVAHLVDPDNARHLLVGSVIEAAHPRIDSLTPVFSGADWHEREAAEMFGIAFVGHPDLRPLLLRTTLGSPPLRKSVVLAARVAVEWPGAAEPVVREDGRRAGNPSRRRQRPPGAPDDWLEPGP